MPFTVTRSSRMYLTLAAILVATFAVVAPVATQGPGVRGTTVLVNGQPAAAGEVLVKYRAGTGGDERRQLSVQMDADEDHEVGGAGVRRVHSRFFDTETLINFLRTDPRVLYAEPNYVVHAIATTPNDPQFVAGNLWGLQNVGMPGADIHATAAWDISTGSRSNVVAVVDTGIDYNHPDLAANVWSAPSAFTVTIAGRTIACPAGSHGFKSMNNSLTMSCDPMDDNNHGTHVSGTIGGVGNNGVGVAGVNWTASIMGAKFLDATGSGTTSDAINVIEFAIQAKARFGAGANVRVLSNSWGGGGASQALLDEINKANTSNMLFVAAAGNNGTNNDTVPFYPANYAAPNVVAVAATTNTDIRAGFSNYGPTKVHLGAPGASILSTIPNGGYAYYSGTSMATPHVAGAAALLLSVCPLDTATLKSTLLANVDQTLVGLVSSGGRLNVDKAIRACSAPSFTVSAAPSSRSVAQGAGTSYSVTVTPMPGFGGTVNLTVTGLPAGATSTFTPASLASGSSTLALTTLPSTPTGTYPLIITGTSGALARSTSVSITVTAANTPPTVSVTGPAAGATYPAPATVTVTAIASDPDGGVAQVDFFANGNLIGSDTTSPYSVTWSNVAAGNYTLTARATDNLGATTTSAPGVAITVTPGIAVTSAAFQGTDTTTQGTWLGVYGTQGYGLAGDAVSYPAYAQVAVGGTTTCQWANPTGDVRALQHPPAGASRVAACWYGDVFTVDVNLVDGVAHRVALYLLDWSLGGRIERVDAVDAGTGAVLDTRTASGFAGGQYLAWTLSGHVTLRVTRTGGVNAVASGVFFDAAPVVPTVSLTAPAAGVTYAAGATLTLTATATAPAGQSLTGVTFFDGAAVLGTDTTSPYTWAWGPVSAGMHTLTARADTATASATSASVTVAVAAPAVTGATFQRTDAATQGTWLGVYGTQGYGLAGDAVSYPAYAQVTVGGATTCQWGLSNDVRALQEPPAGASRVAACWYGDLFTVDVNLLDGAAHRVALYLLDWSLGGRVERVDAVDAATGAVLDTRTATGFSGGQYLVWTLSGHVTLRVTRTGGVNAVASAVFFDPVP